MRYTVHVAMAGQQTLDTRLEMRSYLKSMYACKFPVVGLS